MPKKPLLLIVADAPLAAQCSAKVGGMFECHSAETVEGAIAFLKEHGPETRLLVQENLPVVTQDGMPIALTNANPFELGMGLIRHARGENAHGEKLINDTTPAFFMTRDIDSFPGEIPGVHVLPMEKDFNMIAAMQPAHYRPVEANTQVKR